ncbi:uncharacterized protein ACHE_50653A [Aspergillus chevalieri]|uniref:Uncharacterized protein n=1 Tax=Aspergillus chevalieri TaxID=182096 RepID=A0A7R7VRK1_ASPCH|nr:uncharacterized protein ACHE_50653A [Aspergillus chevalieri]BCR89455.1 hypothetical protein ACHE_50653A [Aspergillus chevalieri]
MKISSTVVGALLAAGSVSGAKLQVYKDKNYKNTCGTFTTSGWHKFNCLARSYHYLSDWNQVCVLFCRDNIFMGYRCQDTDQPDTEFSFNRINIYVGRRPSC